MELRVGGLLRILTATTFSPTRVESAVVASVDDVDDAMRVRRLDLLLSFFVAALTF